MNPYILLLSDLTAEMIGDYGSKAVSLGRLISAGLPVPPGFCISNAAFKRYHCTNQTIHQDKSLLDNIERFYCIIGREMVAVRSSAQGEDGLEASHAGQHDTFLGIAGMEEIVNAIEKCWASVDSERAICYRKKHGITESDHSVAVIIQNLVPAVVAGVLFTQDPFDISRKNMLVEASWGLGESVVSGRFMPDRYQIARDTGLLVDQKIANKNWTSKATGIEPTPPELVRIPCLNMDLLLRLVEMGKLIEQVEKGPRDIEWAFDGEHVWLLQSRPITSESHPNHEMIREEEIKLLSARIGPRGTIWSRFNLSEVLPFPTPMTWSIVKKFLMSGSGAYGLMFKDLGYDPHPSLDEEGTYELVGGRPYCNLSKEAMLHDRHLPFEHCFQDIKKNPSKAYYPSPTLNLTLLPWRFWAQFPVLLPVLIWKLGRGRIKRRRLLQTFSKTFTKETIPSFLKELQIAKTTDFGRKSTHELLNFLDEWCEKCLVNFARESLKATALAALSLDQFQRFLSNFMGNTQAKRLTQELMKNLHLPEDVDFSAGIFALNAGSISLEHFLDKFGHRGPEEMELSNPRWSEEPSDLNHLHLTDQKKSSPSQIGDLLNREPYLSFEQKKLIEDKYHPVESLLSLRETGKHFLLLGYAIIRDILLTLDKRWGLEGGIFFLNFHELCQVESGMDFSAQINSRKIRRKILASMTLPSVIFSDDLQAIGRPSSTPSLASIQGIPLSSGVAEGIAMVLEQPKTDLPLPKEFILICPSTDPAWIPFFIKAKGVAIESGGVLSHGAIVARELGLPAVGGIPDLLKIINPGSSVRINGSTGKVDILDVVK